MLPQRRHIHDAGGQWRVEPLSQRRADSKTVVIQSSPGIDLALLRLDLLEVKCSSLVKKYQGPRT